jgi:hypothetical protein
MTKYNELFRILNNDGWIKVRQITSYKNEKTNGYNKGYEGGSWI